MKDLAFLLITLGLITFGMFLAQQQYRGEEKKKTETWTRERYQVQVTPSASVSPTPTPSTDASD
jgi:hypothetical protein